MTDHYAKNCQIESITPQDISPVADFVAKSTINQMSVMCVDYLTDQLVQAYIRKYEITMEGKNREELRNRAKRLCSSYLVEASQNIKKQI